MYIYMYMYIYIYIYRCSCICIYAYIYVYITRAVEELCSCTYLAAKMAAHDEASLTPPI